jgi:aminodeoxyfutalosine synthase
MIDLIDKTNISSALREISRKVLNGIRLTQSEAIELYNEADLGLIGTLADHVRKQKNGEKVYYNRNIHIEPTNICVYDCNFCSYSHHSSGTSWEFTMDEMAGKVREMGDEITEVHIVGAVHPARDIYYYGDLIGRVRAEKPGVHIKAFTAIEIEYMANRAGLSLKDGLQYLKDKGLNSIPGGGAEIFDETIREKICGKKSSAKAWLEVHETAHQLGIPSNATILYGHIEKIEHRIDHLDQLRKLQDRTGGFNAFIPLKYRNKNNEMSWIEEVPVTEDMRNFAISRIYLDNFPHIKAYWPMLGKQMAALALSFGVDDLDGTINDSTKIYSMAGADDQSPSMSVDEIRELCAKSGRIAVERDSLYNIISGNSPGD